VSGQTRLAVNINDDTAEVLRDCFRHFGWSATECVRQAFGLLKFAINTRANGGRLAVLSDNGREVREVVFDWEIVR
jgi:hypothetical protein